MLEKLKEPEFVFAGVVTLLAFIVDMVAFQFKLQYLEHDMKVMILTVWNGQALMGAINYVLGSSGGSKTKDAKIAELAQQQK